MGAPKLLLSAGAIWPRYQWRNEVRWRPGQEATLAPPCSNLRSFGSKCIVLKNVRVTLLGFSAPVAVIRRPGNCAPLPPSLCPCSVVRDSGVDLYDTRGVTRLDGVRGKKQIWRPHVWIWGLMEANLLYWRKYLWHFWEFSTSPRSDSAPGYLLPLAPLVTPLHGMVVLQHSGKWMSFLSEIVPLLLP